MQAVVRQVRPGYLIAEVPGHGTVLCAQDNCEFTVAEVLPMDAIDIGEIQDSPKGLRGMAVNWVSRPEQREFEGEVMKVNLDRCYLYASTGVGEPDIYCHVSEFADYRNRHSATFFSLALGDRVRGLIVSTPKGDRGIRLERAD